MAVNSKCLGSGSSSLASPFSGTRTVDASRSTEENLPSALPVGYAVRSFVIEKVIIHDSHGICYQVRDDRFESRLLLREFLPAKHVRREQDFCVVPLDEKHGEVFAHRLSNFMSEAASLSTLRHPSIAHVHTVLEKGGTAYMVMEDAMCRTLSDVIRNRLATLHESLLSAVLFSIFDGLQLVHAAGLVHGAVMPESIGFRSDGTPLLIGLGSSEQHRQLSADDVRTLAYGPYAPIEQCRRPVGVPGSWTDIYAIAASVYHIVCGRPPVDAQIRRAMISEGRADPQPSFSTFTDSQFSAEFVDAMDSALQLRPDDRPSTLQAWRAMFNPRQRYTANSTISAKALNPEILRSGTHTATAPSDDNSQVERTLAGKQGLGLLQQPVYTKPRRARYWLAAAIVATLLALIVIWWISTERATVEPEPDHKPGVSEIGDLPAPTFPLELVSPIDQIKNEIESIEAAFAVFRQIDSLTVSSDDVHKARRMAAQRLYLLADSPFVSASPDMRRLVAAAIVATTGISSDNSEILAGLVMPDADSTMDINRLQELLQSDELDAAERATLIYGLAWLPGDQRAELERAYPTSGLLEKFTAVIIDKTRNYEFFEAARMTELALLLWPADERLLALEQHLQKGENS